MADATKTRLGRYELLLPPVGEGSEGLLYKAHCVESCDSAQPGELVALKRLRHVGREMRPDRFQRQAELLRKLTHPNIVRHKDSFVWRDEEADDSGEVYCLVTEWLEGHTLKSLIEQTPTGIPWEIAEGILLQVLQALVYASAERVVHRDLKPSNIYLVKNGADQAQVKLIDFGIARPMDAEATTTTTTVSFEGTWHWMAPDFVKLQEDSFRGDEQSDIYSFGVCFYQVLTGKFPYGPIGENPQFAYFQRWLAPSPPKMAPHPNLNVLKGARSCIQKCLEVDREKRFKSFEELLEAFSRIKYRQLRHPPEIYEYRKYLGQGGFGQVYQGRRLSDGRTVAIKELIAGQHARRFVKEAKILQKASHPHLVEYLDFFEVQGNHVGEDSRYFLVLEYLEGMPGASLRDRIRKDPAEMEAREALVLFRGYLDCLEHLHQHPDRIIHRDIKPGNLYAPPGLPENGKLFDLGIAHEEEGTKTHGQVPGTLDYMPPEFAIPDCGRGSPQSDLYSLALTLYEALTKALPFPRLPPGEKAWVEYITRALQRVECTFEHRVFAERPELASLLRTALANDPQQRFPSAKAMRDEIQKILDAWDRQAERYQTAIAAAQTALTAGDFPNAERSAKEALGHKPRDSAAEQLLAQISERRQALFEQARAAAEAACKVKNYAEAKRQAESALALQPENEAAQRLLARIQQEEREQYQAASRAAKAALSNQDFSEAERQAEEALRVKPNDETVTELLAQVRDEQRRVQATAKPRPPALTIPITLEELEGASLKALSLDEPATASTAAAPPAPATANEPQSATTRHTRQTRKSESTSWRRAPQAKAPSPWAVSKRPRNWAPIAGAAGAAVLVGAGIYFFALRDSGGSARSARSGTAVLRQLAPGLLTNPVVQAEPALQQAFRSLPPVANLSERDVLPLESALATWWTNSATLIGKATELPLAPSVSTHIKAQAFERSYPGLADALPGLEQTASARQSIASALTHVQQEWITLRREINSRPELASWRTFSVSTNVMQAVVEKDFEQLLAQALGGPQAEWTVEQFRTAFGATKSQMAERLTQKYYQPPDKLAALSSHKSDPKHSPEVRDFAGASLAAEIRALETAAQPASADTYSAWKVRLEEEYRPRSRTQLVELPALSDVDLVERNLDDRTVLARQQTTSTDQTQTLDERAKALKTRLASLRKQVTAGSDAAVAGVISKTALRALGGKLFSELQAIQNSIGNLVTAAK